jgi:hypothetical protein
MPSPVRTLTALVAAFGLCASSSAAIAGSPEPPGRLDAGERGRVQLNGTTWQALQTPDDPDAPPMPGPHAAFRRVELEPTADALLIRATWELDAWEPGWLDTRLIDAGAQDLVITWNDGPAAWEATPSGAQVTGRVDGPTTLRLRAELPGDPFVQARSLWLLPAIRGEVRVVVGEGVDAELGGYGHAQAGELLWWSGAHDLTLSLKQVRATSQASTLAVGQVGLGLTIGDSELLGRARVRWAVRRGSLERLALRVGGLGEDLQVTGPTVRSVSRSGDRLLIALQAPADGLVAVDLTWSRPLPRSAEARLELPTITPLDVRRVEASLQLARDGEWEALPELAGWEPRSASLLPEWGRGLVEGTPTAAFASHAASASGSIGLLRFEPVAGPPVMIDIADCEVATTAEGRALVRVRYEVVNDRGAHLTVLPPFGSTFLTVRVDEEPVVPVRVDDGWRVPLPRSLETVAGLISVPVEIVLLVEGEPWERREIRSLPLPRVDAPMAVSRVTVYLPPGFEQLQRGPDGRRVDDFTEGEGISWGFLATDDVDRERAAQADVLFKQAADAWMTNDFDGAQAHLDTLTALGASNVKTDQLQSNLDVVFDEPADLPMGGLGTRGTGQGGGGVAYGSGGGSGSMGGAGVSLEGATVSGHGYGSASTGSTTSAPPEKVARSSGEEALRRRIRDQARARADDEYRSYDESRREAEQKMQVGDYKGAEVDLRRAREIGDKLELYEQEESGELEWRNEEIDRQLAEVTVQAEEKEKRERRISSKKSKPKRPALSPPPVVALAGKSGGRASVTGQTKPDSEAVVLGHVGVPLQDPAPVADARNGRFGEGEAVVYDRVTTIDFEEDVISGELLTPEAYYSVDIDGDASGFDSNQDCIDDDEDGYEFDEEIYFEDIAELPPSDTTSTLAGTLTVTAATRSVPIPRIGQSVRFQQMLLPAGQAPEVLLRARLPISEGTPR